MTTPDYTAITQRQQATWATGDFNVIALQTMAPAEELCRAVDPRPRQRVLDIACGSGNAALIAARRACEVSGIDYVPALVERAQQRAAAEGTRIDFRVADAQALPYPDGHFDVVMSVFGVMFAPDQDKAAAELLRVCRPGGKIGLVCWMPEDFGGDFFRTVARFTPPPAGLKPGVRWGTEQGLRELLGGDVRSIEHTRPAFTQYFASPQAALDTFRTYFGPVARAYDAVGPERHDELSAAIGETFAKYNRVTDGTGVYECRYMQTLAVRA